MNEGTNVNKEGSMSERMIIDESPNEERKSLKHLLNVCQVMDRYHTSDRAGAAIVSSLLVDIGIVTSDNRKDIIDRYKIRRMRDRTRNQFKPNYNSMNVQGIYFDGRQDKTKIFDNNCVKTI